MPPHEQKHTTPLFIGADIPMPYAKTLEDAAIPKPHHVIDVVRRVCSTSR
jgi:pyruvate/2-oxoglutarate/acetoin dehydrogenase E1 component